MRLILALLLVSGQAAYAAPHTHADGSVTWDPPAQYDRPFAGEEAIHLLPQREVPAACERLFDWAGLEIETTPNQKGCAAFKGKVGVIISIDAPFQGVTPEAVIRHERGHLNGWPADHPE